MWVTLYETCSWTTPFQFIVIPKFSDQDYWSNKDPVFPEDALIWFTEGPRADSGTGSGIYGIKPNTSLSFPLGNFATLCHTEIHTIIQRAYENIRRAYRHKQILIFSDSRAALKALSSPKVNSELVAECLEALSALASTNEVTLAWVPGHCGIPGNEEADKLARQASAMPLLGSEPVLGISRCSAREAIKNWTECQHYIAWKDLPGQRHGKLFISRPHKRRAEDLLK
jgi:ribonuclease HI